MIRSTSWSDISLLLAATASLISFNERFNKKHETIANASNTDDNSDSSDTDGRAERGNMIEIKEMRSLDDRTDYSRDNPFCLDSLPKKVKLFLCFCLSFLLGIWKFDRLFFLLLLRLFPSL